MAPKARRSRFAPIRRSSACLEPSLPSATEPVDDPWRQLDGVEAEMLMSPAEQRRRLYSLLAWRHDYACILDMEIESNREKFDGMASEYVSGYSRAVLRAGGDAGLRLARNIDMRMNDIQGFLARSANMHFVPWSQSMRTVSYLHDQVNKVTWAAECHARRLAGRPYAVALLEDMCKCRPPPEFELHDALFAIGYDQTYVSSAGIARDFAFAHAFAHAFATHRSTR
jgi:hypothetical protein